MEFITIEPTSSSPLISFNPSTNSLCIIGESYPENSFDFYAPVISWLRASLETLQELTLDMTITYLNSSSTKCIFDILDIMEEAFGRGVNTSIIWRYDIENSRSYEMAEDFREEVTFPFEIKLLTT
jgi:hypothetical protein